MKYPLLAVILLSLPPIPCLGLASDDALQVMLQGEDSRQLHQLVESKGGVVTHDLPIINAVGAQVSQSQLTEILQSPLVSRHIDDLAITYPHDEENDLHAGACRVSGALELETNHDGISWRLYNKLDNPAALKKLAVHWPDTAGKLTAISLGDKRLDESVLTAQQEGSLAVEFPQQRAPQLVGRATLDLHFRAFGHAAGTRRTVQKNFTIEADFYGDCSAKLIPGYSDNHDDFHYAAYSGANALHEQGITGRDVTVAVLDSGLWEAPDLVHRTDGEKRILARYNAITNEEQAALFDDSGHGTHMTSVIAHSGLIGGRTNAFKGVAPDANLVIVKAFDATGHGGLLDIVRAIQWVVDHREAYHIRILNLSFAARPRWHYWEDPINQATMRAWASGITVVAAAGNEGPDPMTIGSPGNLPYIITVGAVTDSWTPDNRADDYIPDFSSRGPTPDGHIKPDIVAPGGHITGITRPGSTLTIDHPEYVLRSGEFVMTGTSQAAAVTSGIAALLIQLQPELTASQIKCKLTTSAEPAINFNGLLAYSPFQQGHGLVNAARAITLGQTDCGDEGMDIAQDINGNTHYQGPAIVDEDGHASLPGLQHMVSPNDSAKGHSDSRRWGVKDHIERLPRESTQATPGGTPFDWMAQYLREKEIMENLAASPDP